jgi:hypothetical protein
MPLLLIALRDARFIFAPGLGWPVTMSDRGCRANLLDIAIRFEPTFVL